MVLKLQGHQELSVRGKRMWKRKKDGTGGSVSGDSVEEANEAPSGFCGRAGSSGYDEGSGSCNTQNRVREGGQCQGPGTLLLLIGCGSQRQAFHQGSTKHNA